MTVKVNDYRLGKTWRVRSGQGTWTRPDPTRQGQDPTRPAVLVHIADPTQPDPTRPAGQPDPGTTLDATSSIRARQPVFRYVTTCQLFI